MGFDAWFFARLDNQDKQRRIQDKEMEFIWLPDSKQLGNDNAIFTHVLYNHYSAPDGFNMYMTGNDAPFIIDEANVDYNAPERATQLMADLDRRIDAYRTNDLFVVFGDDFKYINAHWMYQNMDNMIEYMNKKHSDKYIFKYSTPSDYIDAVKKHDITWPSKTDDMFPYGAGAHDYWTGYFSSRANAKEYIRRTSMDLNGASLLFSRKILE